MAKYYVYNVDEEIETYGQEKPEYRREYDSDALRLQFIGTIMTSDGDEKDPLRILRKAIDKMSDEWVAEFLRVQNGDVVEKVSESRRNESKDINDVYSKNLKDKEDLDNIWVLHEFTDNLDSKDGYSYEEYTKIGLIDTINNACEPLEVETLTANATNEEVIDMLEYLGTNAELVRIKPYSERNF